MIAKYTIQGQKSTFHNVAVFLLVMVISSCGSPKHDLQTGIWRATLKTESAAEVPFNFEVTDSLGQKRIDIINGLERLRVNEITHIDDSLFIKMPLFDSEIRAAIKGNTLTGNWINHLADKDVYMEFFAKSGDEKRFFHADKNQNLRLPKRWATTFTRTDPADTTIAVGEFSQQDGKLLGTFLTSTGDYRFLEGTISDDKLYLSCFDGAQAYLFTGRLLNDSTIVDGRFYAGYSTIMNWTARKDDNATLPDAYSLTALKPGFKSIDFTFPDIAGRQVSLSDEKFKNKVVLVQFFGTWCPNCVDETAYLVPFYKKYHSRGVEIVGLAYERTADPQRSGRNVQRLRDRFSVPYDMLLTGHTNNTGEVARSLPMLENFMAFPTLIVIDKKGRVRKIHTGFSGPGTGDHYTEFVKEFEETIDSLLAE